MYPNLRTNVYLETTVQTASPAQLLIMLYDGAIRFSRKAIEAIRQQDYAEANRCLIRVQDIVNEFIITLDRKSPVAPGLLSLYDYFNRRLIEANVKKSAEPVEEVMEHLISLKAAWVEAAAQIQKKAGDAHGERAAGTSGSPYARMG